MWALAIHLRDEKNDIIRKRNQTDESRVIEKLKPNDWVLHTTGGLSHHKSQERWPESTKGFYFGYFYPEHNVIENCKEMVENSQPIYTGYDTFDESFDEQTESE
jgi:hypothetical protein